MTDQLDAAKDLEEKERDAIINNRKQYIGTSATHCYCGEPIPEKRRQLLPGVKTCIDCQTHIEKQNGKT